MTKIQSLALALLCGFTFLLQPASQLSAQDNPPVPADEKTEKEGKKEKEPKPNDEELVRQQEEQQRKQQSTAAPSRVATGGDEKKEDEKKWDVSNPPGPSYEARIDTTTGTWMSLDVSPGGDEIVFDLLGDIYVIPIGGGDARPLASGIPWDMQPRYSPDGRRIAFTSDRAGGDNIWVMDRDGSNPKQVTEETFRLPNSPAWSPDGQFIAARKHFTSTRSLGAGEIWIYHTAGGEGLQLTKRPNDQKDAGEPVFSPDGRYVYFSQDVTPGPIFEYNKDPNGEIYVIQRLDRQTGEIERFITGAGGSIRPTPSPDGKSLAFVRRVRTKSVLFVADLESGEERPLFDGLDRDMQETWAVHGVYPTMAWTPDNRSIIFWSGGRINRVDVASGRVTNIPFRVRDTRRVTEALRTRVDVAGESFAPKMLRWVQVSPKGDRVVYQALGHLYVRDLPAGSPRRLTRQSDHFEFYPSFSRDGRSIVYTTWNDDALGSIRVVPAGGGEGRKVTSRPGHYLEPVFSPDGSRIVYRRTGGGHITSSRFSRGAGIYVISATGGRESLVTKKGVTPQFGASSSRVYLLNYEGEDKRSLVSVDLDGSDERTHLLSESATEYSLSPDERWIAFSERFNVYIAPFVPTGKSVDIGPDTKAVPVTKVSRDAGEYIHWSGDSRRLHWSLGPELFTRELREAFAFLEGAPAELPKPAERGLDISFRRNEDVPSGHIALTGARIITMRGDEVIENGTIVVDRNRIVAVGPSATVPVPAAAHRIDVTGKTIMPGLIDVHWHGSMGTEEMIPQQNWVTLASLAFGVTTIHDPSNDTSEIFAASEMARAGIITAPRIFSTGTILYGAKAPFKAIVETIDDARSHLRRMKAVGAFTVKSYNQPRRDQRQKVIQAARELDMMVVPEGGSLFQHNMSMIVDGHTGIEHSIPVARIYDDVLQFWPQTRTYYTPTLVVGYGGLWGENYWYQHTNIWSNERLLNFVPREIIDARSRRRITAPEEEFNHFNNARIAKELADRGVGVQLGAHGQREGLAAHWETWMFVQGGMTPMQALRSATLSGAKYLGLDGEIGSLEPGKLADVIVLDQNPLENIRNSETVRYTVINGRIFDAMTMNEIGNHPRTRPPLFWQREGTPPARATTHAHD